MRKLKDPCTTCGKPLDPSWRLCPYCETEVVGGEPMPTGRRSRRRRTTEQTIPGLPPSDL